MSDPITLIQPFGPQIGVSQLPENINRELIAICLGCEHDTSKRMNSQLVGMIEKEFRIKQEISNSSAMPLIKQAVLDYLSTANSVYKNLPPIEEKNLQCTDAWCNIQEVGEFNPIHAHPSDDVVVVLFPLVEIDVNHHKYTRNVKKEYPGSLVFYSPTGDPRYGQRTYRVSPQTADFYVFPASLEHYTMPTFNENDIRISISCNFSVKGL
jgi:hypothetical protein